MDVVNSNMIGNLFSSFVSDYYKLDSRYTVAITTLISSILITINARLIMSYFTEKYFFSFFVLILVGIGIYKFFKKKKETPDNYTYISTYSYEHCHLIQFMMKKHPEFYTKEYNMITGNPEYRSLDIFILPDEDEKIYFNDTLHGVKGYMTLSFTVHNSANSNAASKVEQKAFFLSIYIEKGCKYNGSEYLNAITEYRDKIRDETDDMILYMTKIMGKKNRDGDKENSYCHEICIYDGKRDNHNERYEKYIKSYFSPTRDRLWNYIYNVHFHPEKFSHFGQEGRCNLLIYGPAGTGKSTFVYRLAMALGRSIVSVDITAISDDRTEVYKTIQCPEIDGYEREPKDFIVLLEEFDITVKHLALNNKKRNTEPSLKDIFATVHVKDDEKKTPFMYSRSTREFELEDLLEVLQGPVPIKGSIIIATTNKYDEIKELCPALFRPGRLTPIEFDYMDWNSLQELSEHYFKSKLNFEPIEIKISTSEIIELALECSLYNESFEKFETQLKKKLLMEESEIN